MCFLRSPALLEDLSPPLLGTADVQNERILYGNDMERGGGGGGGGGSL